VRPFDYIVKAGQPPAPKAVTGKGEIMPQYLVAIHHPDSFDSSTESEATVRAIDALNEEMAAARVVIFLGGLTPVREAKSLRARPDGKVLVTDGPYLETKEHIGGFWVLELADMNEALAWGRKAAVACRAPVEVRAFGIPT
jgi:hypothetical protein